MEDFKIGDPVKSLKTHQVGKVVGVGTDVIKVCFNSVKSIKGEPSFVMQNCPRKELEKL